MPSDSSVLQDELTRVLADESESCRLLDARSATGALSLRESESADPVLCAAKEQFILCTIKILQNFLQHVDYLHMKNP